MKAAVGSLLTGIALVAAGTGEAQSVGDVFKKVLPSVAVIRAKGTEISARTGGVSSYKETGSGVLIWSDGEVVTAGHVVHAMGRDQRRGPRQQTVQGPRDRLRAPSPTLPIFSPARSRARAPSVRRWPTDRSGQDDPVVIVARRTVSLFAGRRA